MSQKKPIRITLFHANWCDYCIDFLPRWEEMRANTNASANIDFMTYEDTEIANLPDEIRTIAGVDVRSYGYPAIKISINGNDYMYTGRRTTDDIYTFILDKLKNPTRQNQSGGSNEYNVKRLINTNDFKILYDNVHILKPFKIV
jgi:thiol-disulfide isomerase/thioredoxin